MLSWINTKRYTDCSYKQDVEVYIDEKFETIESVQGLKTSLFPHQKPVIKAMIDLENASEMEICERGCRRTLDIVYSVTSNAGVLSEAVGSGKTIDILSLILLSKIPKNMPDIADIYMREYGGRKDTLIYSSAVRRTYHNILTPTIVFVGKSVMRQWLSAIKTFTTLSVYMVSDVYGLQRLIDMMVSKQVNDYDVILVKNGKITRPVILPDNITVESKNLNRTTLYIYNILVNMRNYCWARSVIDDFDTIKLPHNAGIIPALFTWYISSTKKSMSIKNSRINEQFKTTGDMLMYGGYSCSNIMVNQLMFYNFNIRNHSDFVKETNNISSVKFYAYVFKNPNDQYMGLMGLMGNSEAKEIMEMLNGDAIETAADRLGIKSSNVSDIFELLLGKQYTKYKQAVNVLDFIEEIEPRQGMRAPMSENPDPKDTYKKSDLFIRREILYNYPNLKSIIDSTKDEYSIIKKESGCAIDRVKSNIKMGECPICLCELNNNDEEVLILKCCGIILCGLCCFGAIFPKNKQNGQCSNCRAHLTFNNLIYINGEFDLNKIVEEKFEPSDEKTPLAADNGPRTKISAILEIIKGIKPPEQTRIDININNMMKGTCQLSASSYNKVLIFANYDETIKNIKTALDSDKIKYWALSGTYKEIADTVDKFAAHNDTCAIIINSTKHCAGLNLQMATDLIFAHRILDSAVETQVIGRGQRIGRTTQLRVHFMMYQNEFNNIINSNSARIIPDVDNDPNEPNLINSISAGSNISPDSDSDGDAKHDAENSGDEIHEPIEENISRRDAPISRRASPARRDKTRRASTPRVNIHARENISQHNAESDDDDASDGNNSDSHDFEEEDY